MQPKEKGRTVYCHYLEHYKENIFVDKIKNLGNLHYVIQMTILIRINLYLNINGFLFYFKCWYGVLYVKY